jgi:small subunit ribosomal protein S2
MACVREANRLAIPIIGLIDTDADPEVIDYPVPGNDDAIKSVRCITVRLVEAIKEEAQKAADLIKRTAEEKEEEKLDIEKIEKLAESIDVDKETKEIPKKKQLRKEV